MNVIGVINNVSDPATRRALQLIFDTLIADREANKATFDSHTHNTGTVYTSEPATNTAGNATGTRATFTNELR